MSGEEIHVDVHRDSYRAAVGEMKLLKAEREKMALREEEISFRETMLLGIIQALSPVYGEGHNDR